MVNNPPAMQETQEMQVRPLGQEDSPGGGHGSPLQYSCLENSMGRGAWRATVHGGPKGSDPTEYTHTHRYKIKFYITVEKLENSGKYKGKQDLE